jgi:hypothetical protein
VVPCGSSTPDGNPRGTSSGAAEARNAVKDEDPGEVA